ncbi:MAG TPA: HEAT repeat domain-containing protein [Gemmataceae bacterium]|nr:HEAT repeat domain-containing protein [Gemmataceae bacterium]
MAGRTTSFTSAAALAALLTAGVAAAELPDLPQPPQPPSAGPGGPPGGPPTPGGTSGTQLTGVPGQPQPPQPIPMVPTSHQRFPLAIEPTTPVGRLMPTPPKPRPMSGPLTTDDLTKVPEAEFEVETAGLHPSDAAKQAAHQLAKINHLNKKQTDAFMKALLESRPDLAGLPFVMGDDCRSDPARSQQFQLAVNNVRAALGNPVQFDRRGGRSGFGGGGMPPNGGGFGGGQAGGMPMQQAAVPFQVAVTPAAFWTQFAAICTQEDATRPATDKAGCEHATVGRVAALMQMLAPESAEMRAGLVKYLAGVSHVEATKALAKLAIFSTESDLSAAAAEALKVRRERDYTAILVAGLRYPFPAVAKRAAEVIAKTGRKDLIPELVSVLDEADPRLPRDRGGKSVVREMVRVNHHRNCMMCHAPGTSSGIQPTAFTAEVPVQGQPLQSLAQGYNRTAPHPDLLVRLDVTYLRQDFSVMLPVTDAAPWPDMQRYDFIVRERELSTHELVSFKETLTPKEEGVVTPYQRAALTALRDLTGKDTAPTAEAWRKLLKL